MKLIFCFYNQNDMDIEVKVYKKKMKADENWY